MAGYKIYFRKSVEKDCLLVPRLCLGTHASRGSALKIALFSHDMGGRAWERE
jgi:hypothetical protein